MRVLIVDGEQRFARLLRRVLEEERYAVDEAPDGESGEELARAGAYDAILLAATLPDRSGADACRDLRRAGVAAPIIMLRTREASDDGPAWLDTGADDELTRPFPFAELLARLRAVAPCPCERRSPPRLRLDDLTLYLLRREVARAGRLIELTPREYALLEFFLRHPGQVLTRQQILTHVWSYDACLTTNAVDTYVHYLREKVDKHHARRLLHTVRGTGYVLRVP